MRHRISLFAMALVLLLSGTNTFAQYYTTGESPARIKWSYIKAGNKQVIYPRGLDSLAFLYGQDLMGTGQLAAQDVSKHLHNLPVVLRTGTSYSNGFVVWAPKRMEFMTIPMQQGYSQRWDKQLTIHESRHYGQMEALNVGFTKILSYFIGQNASGFAVGVHIPKWFLEGDAVLAETMFSNSGRGRQASFLMPAKALIEQGGEISRNKWKFGSYKTPMPNDYVFGYLQLSYLQSTYGNNPEAIVLNHVGRNSIIPLSFLTAFTQPYGGNALQMWDRAKDFHLQGWQSEPTENRDTPNIISKQESCYVTWGSPVIVNGKMYATKSSASRTNSLYQLTLNDIGNKSNSNIGNNIKEKELTAVGDMTSTLRVCGDKIYWTEISTTGRWAYKDYSVVKEYNTTTGKKRSLTHKTRYYTPCPSPEGNRIAVYEYLEDGSEKLNIISSSDGHLLNTYNIPSGLQATNMVWGNGETLYLANINDTGVQIDAFDLNSATWSNIVPLFNGSISGMNYLNGILYFTTDLNGKDDIYAVDIQNKKMAQVTNARYGAFSPYVTNGTMYYTNYSINGYAIASSSISTQSFGEKALEWTSLPNALAYKSDEVSFERNLAARLSANFEGTTQLQPSNNTHPATTLSHPATTLSQSATPKNFEVKPYRKVPHLLRVHSWMPIFYDVDELRKFSSDNLEEALLPGATILTQNTLGDTYGTIGAFFKDGKVGGKATLSYRGLLPVFSLEAKINDRDKGEYQLYFNGSSFSIKNKENDDTRVHLKLLTYIPLTFVSNGWVKSIIPSASFEYCNDIYPASFNSGETTHPTSLQYGVSFSIQKTTALRDIFPRYGFSIDLQGESAISHTSAFGKILYGKVGAYLPGLFPNHSILLSAAYQKQSHSKGTLFSLQNVIEASRGYDWDTIYSENIKYLSIEYVLPIIINDFSIGDLMYLKRLQLRPFYDYTNHNFSSYGISIIADTHLLHIGNELSIGARVTNRCNNQLTNKLKVEAVISIAGF